MGQIHSREFLKSKSTIVGGVHDVMSAVEDQILEFDDQQATFGEVLSPDFGELDV